MQKWIAVYVAWAVGVLSAAGVAYWYWVRHYGEESE